MALTVTIKVVPRSSRSTCVLDGQGILKCYVKSPPEDGKANKELITLLARTVQVPLSAVQIISGNNRRIKTVRIDAPVTFAVLLKAFDIVIQKNILE